MDKLSKLAMLEISDVENLQKDIDAIIKMAEVLKDIESEIYVAEEGFLRDDNIEPSFERKEMCQNAPCENDGFFIVPKTVG